MAIFPSIDFRKNSVHLGGVILIAMCLMAGYSSAELSYKKGVHETSGGNKVQAEYVENEYFRAAIVPEMGGRILELIDKSSGKNLVYERKYGGLLDDHGARVVMPYKLKWIKQDAHEGVVELLLDEEVVYRKTLTFYADKPLIQVDYHCENHGQDQNRMLLRNVVRPGGGTFSENDIYCSARTNGLVQGDNLPYRDLTAEPWAALVNRADRTVVANYFEGDAIERFYSWRKGIVAVAPTYEFTFQPLQAGHEVEFRYYWIIGHGYEKLDYAHRAFLARLEGEVGDGRLSGWLDLSAVWAPMTDVEISGEVLNADRGSIAKIETWKVSLAELDDPIKTGFNCPVPDVESHYILQLTLRHPDLEEPVVIEKLLPLRQDKLELPYERPIRMAGAKVEQRPIKGWEPEVDYVALPTKEDSRRGYLVFEESGDRAGQHTSRVELDLAQNEPEGFPLHFFSTGYAGKVRIETAVPDHFKLETFVPEQVPAKFWTGEVRYGLKLIEGTSFEVREGEDRTVFFRLTAGEPPAGTHSLKIRFVPEKGSESEVEVAVRVYPIRFADQPLMVFDANNSVNSLATRPGKTRQTPEWDQEHADNFFYDMRTHGIRGHAMNGVSSPFSHFWYNRVKLRDSGVPLLDAIKKSPEVFQDRLDLPALDFGEWDWFCDQFLRNGMTHFRVQLGGCGERFLARHSKLTRLVYGEVQPPDSLRENVIREWYDSEAVRYFKDRGIMKVYAIIDDEIPSEKYSWWIQHANSALRIGFEPGVTMAAELIASDNMMAMVEPVMRYWVIGTMHKDVMDLRYADGTFKPRDRIVTYHSSANHWQKYDQMRGRCGFDSGYYNLDACWIQTYDRFYSQIQTVVYPGEKGPISSAAWEGARDGLDDANYLLLARALAEALPPERRAEERAAIERIVGMKDDSLIRFHERPSDVGDLTVMGDLKGNRFRPYRTADFRRAKRALLDKAVELGRQAPEQRAAVKLGDHNVITNGYSCFQIAKGTKYAAEAVEMLAAAVADQRLQFERPSPREIAADNPYPVFYLGTLAELAEKLPELRNHPDLRDLDEIYPPKDGYVVRMLKRPTGKSGTAAEQVSMVVLGGSEEGIERACANLRNVFVPPRYLYSHWLK